MNDWYRVLPSFTEFRVSAASTEATDIRPFLFTRSSSVFLMKRKGFFYWVLLGLGYYVTSCHVFVDFHSRRSSGGTRLFLVYRVLLGFQSGGRSSSLTPSFTEFYRVLGRQIDQSILMPPTRMGLYRVLPSFTSTDFAI